MSDSLTPDLVAWILAMPKEPAAKVVLTLCGQAVQFSWLGPADSHRPYILVNIKGEGSTGFSAGKFAAECPGWLAEELKG